MLCCRSVLFSPCLLTCVNWNKNQLFSKIKIFRCLRRGFNLVLELWAGFLPHLLVSDAAKLKTLPSNGKLLKIFLSWLSSLYNHYLHFLAGHRHISSKMECPLAHFELYFSPPLLTSIPLSHSLGSLNLKSINTLKIKTDPIWNEVISLNLFSEHIMTNNSCLLYNMLRIQTWPGFNLLASRVVKGENSSCTIPSPSQLIPTLALPGAQDWLSCYLSAGGLGATHLAAAGSHQIGDCSLPITPSNSASQKLASAERWSPQPAPQYIA